MTKLPVWIAGLSMLALAVGGCASGNVQTISGARAEANFRECVDKAKAGGPYSAGPKQLMTEIYSCMAVRGYSSTDVDAIPVPPDVLMKLLEKPTNERRTQ